MKKFITILLIMTSFPFYTSYSKIESNDPLVTKHLMSTNGTYHKGERVGKWVFYFEGTKKIRVLENYKNGLLDGEQFHYNENGSYQAHLHYKEGKKIGLWRYYNENGELTGTISYSPRFSQEVCYRKNYDRNGIVSSEGQVVNGEKNGTWKNYDDLGILLYTTEYFMGYKSKIIKIYDKNNEPFMRVDEKILLSEIEKTSISIQLNN